jgi:hypothetical protein
MRKKGIKEENQEGSKGKAEKNERLKEGEYVNLDWVLGKDHGQKKVTFNAHVPKHK